jgi:hypothetical protein
MIDDFIIEDEAEKKSYYVMQTIYSICRLSGYRVKGDLILSDWEDREHSSRDVMPKYKHRV